MSALLIQEEVNRAREVPDGDHPRDSSAQEEGTNREDILGKRVLDDSLTKKNSVTFSSTQWSKQPSMIRHRAMPHHYRVTYDGLDMVGPIMLGLSNVLLQQQWIKIIIVE